MSNGPYDPPPPAPGQQPGYGPSGYPPPGYAPPGYPQQYGPPPSRGTNGMAIASMVLGIVWLYGLGSLLAVIFGHVSLNQTKQSGQGGRGMAVAGLVLGYIGLGILLVVILSAVNANNG